VRSGITLDEFVRTANALACTPSPIVSALVKIRLLIGQLLCWDREPAASAWEPFESRMTSADHSQSLVPAGTPEGLFRVVYRFENEQLLELINRTAHAAALSALVETANSYRFYFGVYVRRVSRFTPIYMALIDPVRQLVVYPRSCVQSARTGIKPSVRPDPGTPSHKNGVLTSKAKIQNPKKRRNMRTAAARTGDEVQVARIR
jgi:hypothetical protein